MIGKMKIDKFKDKHSGEVCIVAGMGASIANIVDYYEPKIILIGCNDANRLLPLDYQVISENIEREDDFGNETTNEKVKQILETDVKYVFTRYKMKFKTAKQVPIEIEHLETDTMGAIYSRNHLFGIRKIPIVGLSLAIYMGFRVIGLIGHDLVGGRAICDGSKNTLNMRPDDIANENRLCKVIDRYCRVFDIKICNLSSVSKVTSFEKVVPRTFKEMLDADGRN